MVVSNLRKEYALLVYDKDNTISYSCLKKICEQEKEQALTVRQNSK